ncbi:MAG: M20 family metallopeptidase [Planctomycetaceae bacterium]
MVLAQALQILCDLIRFPSISSTSNRDISQYVADCLTPCGMRMEVLSYNDPQGVRKVNVVATRGTGVGAGLRAHTDVVPVEGWEYPQAGPFEPHQTADRLYGRGSCDMKGSLACFLAALLTTPLQRLRAPITILCTADEEIGYHGAEYVAAHSEIYRDLREQQPIVVIGEPTSLQVVHAHKGIYVFKVTSRGKAGHSSTEAGVNANLRMIPFLQEMARIYHATRDAAEWRDDRFSPPGISWNIGINDFTQAANITPERSVCTVSFRPMPGQDAESLVNLARDKAEELGLTFELQHGARPGFVAPESPHIQELLELTGKSSSRTVAYGTDAAMFEDLRKIVICGPGDIAQAHTVDEWIALDQMQRGIDVYRRMIERFCL